MGKEIFNGLSRAPPLSCGIDGPDIADVDPNRFGLQWVESDTPKGIEPGPARGAARIHVAEALSYRRIHLAW